MQVADEAVPKAQEFNQEQLQPAAEYIAKNFEKEAKRLADEVGPLAEGLPKAMRRAVQLNKVCTAVPPQPLHSSARACAMTTMQSLVVTQSLHS